MKEKLSRKSNLKGKKGQNRDIKCSRKGMFNEVYDGRKMGQNEKRNWKRCGWCLLNCVQNFLMALLWCHVDEYLNFICDFSFCLLDDGVLTLINTSLALSGLRNYPLYNYHGMVNKIFHIFIRYYLNDFAYTWRTVVPWIFLVVYLETNKQK